MEKCKLCSKQIKSILYENDDVYIGECNCGLPIVVLKRHTKYPTHEEKQKCVFRLLVWLKDEMKYDLDMEQEFDEHFHVHARLK